MFLSVALLSLMALAAPKRLEFTSTTSAASSATSVPLPMAIPTSALVKAGASFIPSPTIATLPFAFSRRISLSLPSGSISARKLSTPEVFATAFAVLLLSPVSITVWIPIPLSSFIAWAESSFTASATAISPRNFPSLAKPKTVFPSSASFMASLAVSSAKSFPAESFSPMNFMLPPKMSLPPQLAERPLPAIAVKLLTSCLFMPFSSE